MRSIQSLVVLAFIVVIFTEVRVIQAQNEASALVEWKASLDKQSQSALVSWDRKNSCQTWIGISCNDRSLSEFVVTGISLPGFSLNGSLDSFNFSLFPNLETLNVGYNSLFGSIPSNLANLSQLRNLNLGRNDFSGVIPLAIGTLPLLESLDLSMNRLTGHIPYTIANLTNLIYLELFGNELTGPIPQEIGMLSPKLKHLSFGFNNLTGEIQSSLGNLTLFFSIYLNNNHLSGTIPPQLGVAKDLRDLWINNNHLTGPIADSFQNFTSLKWLDLSLNNLSGSFPKDINLSRITSFSVNDNSLSGHLPKDMSNIKIFEIDNNLLSRPLPQFGKLVERFTASNNFFSSGIPLDIGNSSNLSILDLSRNKMSGPVPHTIPNLKYLSFFNLDDNMLNGTLPMLPINIIAYSVQNNTIAGKLPYGICSLNFLEVLHLSNNNISGALPDCFRNSTLTSLNLNGNRLQGRVPRSQLLEVLDLGNNMLNDTFPHWLDDIPPFQVLVLRSNKLHGSIEASNNKPLFPNLRILDLSGNLFTSSLPSKYFENLKAMMNINEQEREPFGGDYEGRDVTYEDSVVLGVKGLEIEYKRIFNGLTTFDLSNNKFGGIPSNIKMLNSLHFLNVSQNHLTGQIPAMLDNLANLESLDLSLNYIQGKIPAELTRLSFLASSMFHAINSHEPYLKGGNSIGSYQGNPGLFGFPLSNKHGDNDVPTQLQQEEEEDDTLGYFAGFTWKSVVFGYGCGIVLGVGLGCLMFSKTRKKRPEIFQFATRRN